MRWIVVYVVAFIIGISIAYIESNQDIYYSIFPSKKPTPNEVYQFVAQDQTNMKPYIYDSYVCKDYSNDVINHAKKLHWRAGFVTLSSGYADHAIVAFDTTTGVYFLEPQLDYIFPESRMKEMNINGLYDVSNEVSSDVIGYFDFSFTGYNIEWK
jgi:hypothetical protein